uniref:MAPK regulated corepressor interacting protein 2 n=1 Tax=Gallus gallus TaxID=9031 RepID=A0A8V0Z853_CHICK
GRGRAAGPARPVKGPARGTGCTRPAGAAGPCRAVPEGPHDVHADARPQQAGHAAPHRSHAAAGGEQGGRAAGPAAARSLAPRQVSPAPRRDLGESPAQKLIFNRVNGKRPQVLLPHTSVPEESYTAAHEENVRFVYEAWQEVEQQLDGGQRGESARGPVQYVEKTPNPRLKHFVPIDLEEWWAQQFLAKIENCS